MEAGREGGRGGLNVSFDSSDVNPPHRRLARRNEGREGGREEGEGKDENTGRRSHTGVERHAHTHTRTLPVYVCTISLY